MTIAVSVSSLPRDSCSSRSTGPNRPAETSASTSSVWTVARAIRSYWNGGSTMKRRRSSGGRPPLSASPAAASVLRGDTEEPSIVGADDVVGRQRVVQRDGRLAVRAEAEQVVVGVQREQELVAAAHGV